MMACIGGRAALLGDGGGYVGVAYLEGFGSVPEYPAWVFSGEYGSDVQPVAETISHEVGAFFSLAAAVCCARAKQQRPAAAFRPPLKHTRLTRAHIHTRALPLSFSLSPLSRRSGTRSA